MNPTSKKLTIRKPPDVALPVVPDNRRGDTGLKVKSPPSEAPPPVVLEWGTVKVTANWSANLFSEETAAAKWIGAEVEVTANLQGVPEAERPNWLLEIHDQLLTVCRDMVETGADKYITRHKGWKK